METNRATVSDDWYPYHVLIDGNVIVGRGTHKECCKLARELNTSDRKCDLLKKFMEG